MATEIALYLSMEKCENSYALEAWFATPFTIIFLDEICEISTESGPNTTHFGELV